MFDNYFHGSPPEICNKKDNCNDLHPPDRADMVEGGCIEHCVIERHDQRKFDQHDIDLIYEISAGRCYLCGHWYFDPTERYGTHWVIEHIHPEMGREGLGADCTYNLRAACVCCNKKKYLSLLEELDRDKVCFPCGQGIPDCPSHS
jgi:hypothetical protein